MSSYLRFFELERSPFDGSGQTRVVLGTRAVREAFGAIRAGIDAGDSRICVSGAAGLGKSSLAHALPKLLGESARVAVVPDPTVGWDAARTAIARQWGLEDGALARPALLAIRAGGPLVLVVDQAERADDDFLDHLDVLLCYRTPQDEPVVQSVLMARLSSGDGTPNATPLHWWLDRIHTLQLEFAPLPRDGVASYIEKHLRRAGWRGAALFDAAAAAAIHGHTGGVPGAISDLCERLLIAAAGRGLESIDARFVEDFCASHAETPMRPRRHDVEPAAIGVDEVGPEADRAADQSADEADAIAAAVAAALPAPESSAAADEPSANADGATTPDGDEAEPVTLELVEPADPQAGASPDPDDETGSASASVPSATSAASDIDLEAALEYFEGAAASAPGSARDEASEEGHATDDACGGRPEGDAAGDPRATDAETGDAATWSPDETDAALLLAPPSLDEMRALRGPMSHPFARSVAAAFAAVLIGGVGLSLLSGDEAPPDSGAERQATMLPERSGAAPGRAASDTPPALADYARDRDDPTASGPVLFAPGPGFVTPESAETTTTPADDVLDPTPARLAVVDPTPTRSPTAIADDDDATTEPKRSQSVAGRAAASSTQTASADSDDTIDVVLETSPVAGEPETARPRPGDAPAGPVPASPSPGTREDR